ncbi:MAG TPA: MFS transporter [Clostridia bacterium]|nr:MFS transporter [Clostridia bacterium]
MKKESLWKLIALSSVPFIMVLGNSMLIPVLPDMQKAMEITKLQAGLSITLFSLPAGIAIPVMGFLADKYGRKPIILPALLLYATGGVLSGLAAWWWQSYPILLAGRIIQGLGASGTGPIAMALVSDIFTSQERPKALGGLEAANGLGKVISPILGAAIALLIWYALFFVYAFLAVPAAVLIWLLIKEPPPEKGNQSVRAYLGKIKEIFQRKGKSLAGCYAAGSAVLLILFGLLSYLSDVLEKSYGLDGIVKGLALAVPVLAMSSTSFFGGRYLERQLGKIKYFIVLGLILVAGPLGAFALFPGDMVFFAGILLLGLGTGLVLPGVNTLVTSSVPLEERGGITALYGGVRFLGVAAGPPVFDFLLSLSKRTMFAGGALLAALALGLALWLVNEQQLLQNLQQGKSSGAGKPSRLSPEPT